MDSPSVDLEAARSVGPAAPEQASPSAADAGADTASPPPPPPPSSTSTSSAPALSETELRTQAAVMQDQLGFILTNIKEIKDNCKRLKTQNQSLQEYIESLMARR